jgi:hypothetical protein
MVVVVQQIQLLVHQLLMLVVEAVEVILHQMTILQALVV